MKSIKRFLIPLLLAVSIILSACAGVQSDGNTDTSAADTTLALADTTADTGESIPEDTPPEETDERYSYEAWRENAYAYLKSVTIDPDGESSLITDDSSTLAWGLSYLLDALYRGYCATCDVAFLDQFSIYIYRIYELLADKDGDGYLSWGTAEYSSSGAYEEFAVHIGMIGTSAGRFVCLVYADPAVAEKESPVGMSYRELADYITDKTVNHLIPSFDCDWNDEIGVYMDREEAGVKVPDSLPHNQYLVMAITMIHFAKVSPEHREGYLYRAERMLSTFSSFIYRYNNFDFVIWNYDDKMFDGDDGGSAIEDFSHGMLDVRAVITGYENGLVFPLKDVNAISNNYDILMYRDNNGVPMLSGDVDGEGSTKGNLYYWMYDMSVFKPGIVKNGMKYQLMSDTYRSVDSPQVLAFHPQTPAPEKFSLAYPQNGESTVSDSVAFLWQRAPHANYYCLQIAEDEKFEKIIVDRDQILDSSVFVSDLPEGKTLYYRVIAKNMKGEETVSEICSFTTEGGSK